MKYLSLAKKISKKSQHKFMMGCVIVKDNFIVSVGFNSIKTHPRSETPFNTTHAEVDAIASADIRDLYGAIIYLYRETKDGKPANSRPCKFCASMLKSSNIKKVFYSHHEFPFWKEEKYF